METLVEKFEAGTWRIELHKRDNPDRYPKYKALLIYYRLTPRGIYQKEKCTARLIYLTEDEARGKAKYDIQIVMDQLQSKQAAKKEQVSLKAQDYYRPGDIVVNSWGYEQTNVDFYVVTSVGNKTINVSEIYSEVVETTGLDSGKKIPCQGPCVKDAGDKYVLRVYPGGRLSNPESYYYMKKWDGVPKYCSWGY